MPKIAGILLIFLLPLMVSAQYTGIASMFTDSSLFAQLRANKVRSVAESRMHGDKTQVNIKYDLDRQYRIVQNIRPSGSVTHRETNEYDEEGRLSKRTTYDMYDTSRVLRWQKFIYDQKGRMVKALHGDFGVGKWTEYTSLDISYKEKKGLTFSEKREYNYDGKLRRTIYTRDSVAGACTFTVEYEFQAGGIKEGVRFGEKTLWRRYTIKGTTYEEKIEYFLEGGKEMAQKLEGSYWINDSLGRWVAVGELFYEALEMKMIQQAPGYKLPMPTGDVVKLVLANKMRGEKKMKHRIIYDLAGRMAERQFPDARYTFKYNDKGQVVQQINEGQHPSIADYTYNEKGLLIKRVWTHLEAGKNGREEPASEVGYEYGFW